MGRGSSDRTTIVPSAHPGFGAPPPSLPSSPSLASDNEASSPASPKLRDMRGGQSLSSVLNNPKGGDKWFPSSATISTALQIKAPPANTADFKSYLEMLGMRYNTFVKNRQKMSDIGLEGRQSSLPSMDEIPEAAFSEDMNISVFIPLSREEYPQAQEHAEALLAIVDRNLQVNLAIRSSTLLEGLENVRQLHEESRESCEIIAETRRRLHQFEGASVQGGLRLALLHRRRERMEAIFETVGRISAITAAQVDVMRLLADGSYPEAMNVLAKARAALQEPDLARVSALRYVSAQLDEAQSNAVRVMTGELCNLATSRPQEHGNVTLSPVRALAAGLHACHKLPVVLHALTPRWDKYLKIEIRKCVTDALKRENAATGSLGAQVAALPHDAFVRIVTVLVEMLSKAVRDFYGLLQEIGEEEPEVKGECMEVFRSARELSHSRLAEIISLRQEKEKDQKLNMAKFLELYHTLVAFMEEGEMLLEEPCHGLRSLLSSRRLQFCAAFHEEQMKILGTLLDHEPWVVVDIPPEFQARLCLFSSAEEEEVQAQAQEDESSKTKTTPSTAVCAAFLMLLKGLDAYAQIVEGLPSARGDIARSVLEYVKLYNSRSCQLVLGAGAVHVEAGLTSITARHLGVSYSCLTTLLSLIPMLGERFQTTLLSATLPTIQEHRAEILNKFTAMLTDRVSGHTTNYLLSVERSLPTGKATGSVVAFRKELLSLVRVLAAHVDSPGAQRVLEHVYAFADNRFAAVISTEVSNQQISRLKTQFGRDATLFLEMFQTAADRLATVPPNGRKFATLAGVGVLELKE
jgi:hypothetical protein